MFRSDLAQALLKYFSRTFDGKNHPFISRVDSPPKLIQLRLYGLYLNERHENIWEAKNIDYLVKRTKQKATELERVMLQGMMKSVRKKLRTNYVAR